MIVIRNLAIHADIPSIITKASQELAAKGITKFGNMKIRGKELMMSCPVHKGGLENNPSFSITLEPIIKRINTGNKIIPAGQGHCFTCHTKGNLFEIISIAFGNNDNGIYGREWIKNNFPTQIVEGSMPAQLKQPTVNTVAHREEKQYRDKHPYLYKRKLTDEVIDMFEIGYDKAYKHTEDWTPIETITFPIRDKDGTQLFIARRAIWQKLFFMPKDVEKPLYGYYEALKYRLSDTLIVCEGLFNSLTAWVYGDSAVALLGTGTAMQTEMLKKVRQSKIVLALDPDEAGRKGTDKIRKALRGIKSVSKMIIPQGKDLNDLTYDEYKNLKIIYC